jgi:uncharacterized protein YdhG (YjbR/CyaY superfamily)
MAKTAFTSVDALRRVRTIIRDALPGAEEVLSYAMPTYKLHRAHHEVPRGGSWHAKALGAVSL